MVIKNRMFNVVLDFVMYCVIKVDDEIVKVSNYVIIIISLGCCFVNEVLYFKG